MNGRLRLRACATIAGLVVAGVALVPASAHAEDCVEFDVTATDGGSTVWGEATMWIDMMACPGWYTGDVTAWVDLNGPGGPTTPGWDQGSYGHASAWTSIWIGDIYHGTYHAWGDGQAYFDYWGGHEYHDDEHSVEVLPPQPPPPCVPALLTPEPLNRTYYFTSHPGWEWWKKDLVNIARDRWNAFLAAYQAVAGFTLALGPGHWSDVPVHLEDSYAGGDLWGGWAGGVIYLNPYVFNHPADFPISVAMHEFGHSRGYVDIESPLLVHGQHYVHPS